MFVINGSSLLVAEPLGSNCKAIVVVPIRNEEGRLIRCLKALSNQQEVGFDQFELILLLNNCIDGSAKLAEHFADSHPELTVHLVSRELPPNQSNIGTARRLLMDEACARFSTLKAPNGTIMTTDGDTAVDGHWVANSLAEISRGADAVGGRICLDIQEMRSLAARVRQQYWWDLSYSLLRAQLECELDPVPWDPWPRHHQNFCGSLAITTAMYIQAGGIPNVQNLEDMALCESILRVGGKIRHSPSVQVRTSARLDGRVSVGLSSHLRGFEEEERLTVESIGLTVAKFHASHRLRKRSANHNEREDLWKSIEEAWRGSPRMPIDAAIQELRELTSNLTSSTGRYSQR